MRWTVLSALLLAACASAPQCKSADAAIETFPLTSTTFGNSRTVDVLLPPCYAETHALYPVLYLNDGASVFKPAAIGIADVMNDLYRRQRVAPIIVVGIDNAGTDRANEYLAYPDTGFEGHRYEADPPHPRGASYPAFLDEVRAAIASRYRISTRRSDTAIGGSSYGADAALFAAMQRPDVFGKLYLESAPLWVGDRRLLDDVQHTRLPSKVYIGVGANETKEADVSVEGRKDFDALVATLRKRGVDVNAVIDPEGTHSPSSWRRRLPVALEFLVPVR